MIMTVHLPKSEREVHPSWHLCVPGCPVNSGEEVAHVS
jgi:hypothetical protein